MLCKLKKIVSQININKQVNKTELGSLVITDKGNYLLSVALGKIDFENNSYFCVSIASPIGQAFFNKSKSDSVEFQGSKITITDIF